MKYKVGFRIKDSTAYLVTRETPSGIKYKFFRGRFNYIKTKEDIEFFRSLSEFEEEGKTEKPKKKKSIVKKVKSVLKKKKRK